MKLDALFLAIVVLATLSDGSHLPLFLGVLGGTVIACNLVMEIVDYAKRSGR